MVFTTEWVFVCLFVCLLACLSVCLLVLLCFFVRSFVCLFVCLSVCLFVCLFARVCVCVCDHFSSFMRTSIQFAFGHAWNPLGDDTNSQKKSDAPCIKCFSRSLVDARNNQPASHTGLLAREQTSSKGECT